MSIDYIRLKSLWLSVVLCAVKDALSNVRKPNYKSETANISWRKTNAYHERLKIKQDAILYILSNDVHFGSFINICSVFDLNPALIRKNITSDGFILRKRPPHD